MRVHVVSDVHGNVDDLARAGEGADALIVLGDLLDFVDYLNPANGIFGALFGAERVAEFARLRRDPNGEAGAFIRSLWSGLDDAAARVDEAVREQYAKLFAAMTVPTYATPGNVDNPELWPEYAGPNVTVLDGQTVEIGGLRVGFVGGALLLPGTTMRPEAPWKPYLRSAEEYDTVVEALGPVDLLCTHIPPAVPELCYDVVARHRELGSAGIRRALREHRPRWSVFGHVHQPLAQRMRVDGTECVNVGHFRQTGVPYVLQW
ncbi:metallophosphoesterase family protein [Actinoalloteichus hymeniacidonis]|uniref:Phosphoesterase, ICC n=1 Tax=Actinoalloteichus hymeniacidonis TaxID=340345 RepID=A0AAC9HSZ6_9PSEU|nr:metallophosphoesterase [Actinoalloteichus hymeniacidonis]AOS65127.1 putative phosphoesterase, ICC [Actinoalloteichus hymeniacidonis]MBB5906794.1 Icc-related predicted phosphoesterase [Actinoalloteichus hymeniacidonis]